MRSHSYKPLRQVWALLLALLLPSVALAKTVSITGVVQDQSGGTAPKVQAISMPSGETGQINFALTHPDGTSYNLTGAQVLLTVGGAVISRQATINSPASGGTGYFPIVIADTLSMLGTYGYDVRVTASDGSAYQAVPVSSFVVTAAKGQPNQPVTVPATQVPLAQGPAGPTGPAGAAGATGATGPQGPSGTSGTLTASSPLTGGGVMSSNVSIGVDATVPHCSVTTTGDYCGWDATNQVWVREPAPSASTGTPVVYFQGDTAAGETTAITGPFWSPQQQLSLGTDFLWQAWARIDSGQGNYILSDGNGGAHALLWDGRAGNLFLDDSTDIFYGSDDDVPPGVLSFVEVLSATEQATAQKYIVTRQNGVPTGRVAFTALRTRSTQSTSNGYAFIGGSDHQNATFYLASLRAFDREYPYPSSASPLAAIVPPKFLTPTIWDGATVHAASLLLDASQMNSGIIPDLSAGYDLGISGGTKYKHDARVYTVPTGVNLSVIDAASTAWASAQPMPTRTYLTGTPLDTTTWPSAPDRGLTPPTTPVGCKIFDSFSRADQTYAHTQLPTLGSTEAGSLGPLPWQQSAITNPIGFNKYWGIYNGRAVLLVTTYGAVAYVDTGSTDMDVRVDRRKGAWGNGETGIAFRYVDANNHWFAYWNNDVGAANELDFGYISGGSYTYRGTSSFADTGWVTLRVVASGGSIQVYTDSTLRYSVTGETQFSTATKAGIVTTRQPGARVNSLARWDNFTVY